MVPTALLGHAVEGDVAARPADRFPSSVNLDGSPGGARRVLDEAQAMLTRDRDQRRKVARHAELMHGKDGFRFRRDGVGHQRRIDVAGLLLHVDEDRNGAAIAHRVRGGDERMADGDDLVALTHARRQ